MYFNQAWDEEVTPGFVMVVVTYVSISNLQVPCKEVSGYTWSGYVSFA